MRAKFINEKFTDTSDPVQDMGIGYKKLLKPYALDKNDAYADTYIVLITSALNLYDSDIFIADNNKGKHSDFHHSSKFYNFVDAIENRKAQKSYIDRSTQFQINVYDLDPGKIMLIYYPADPADDNTIRRYWGDLDAAVKFDVLHNVKED